MSHRPADFAAARRIGCIGSGLLMSILVALSISGADAQESGVDLVLTYADQRSATAAKEVIATIGATERELITV